MGQYSIGAHTAEILGVVAERPRNSFRLRVDGRLSIYIYKAPPEALDIRALTFDESDLKLEIRDGNADQLSFNFDIEPAVSSTVCLPTNLVIVHFGDPVDGFDHAEVGAPYTTTTGACDWAWHEHLQDEPFGESASQGEPDPAGHPDGTQSGLGLRLRDVADADDDIAES